MYYLLGTLINDIDNRVLEDCISNNDPAANRYQKALLSGFIENGRDIKYYSYKFVSSSFYHSRLSVLKKYMSLHNNILIKKRSYFVNFFEQILFFFVRLFPIVTKNDTLIVYSLDSARLLIAYILKILKRTRVCVVITDLPEYMSTNPRKYYLFLKKINNVVINKVLKNVDRYVLLTSEMQKYLSLPKEKCIVVEGIYLNDVSSLPDRFINKTEKIVLYTGTLAKRYGILNLLESFLKLSKEYSDYKLVICGRGETEYYIKQIQKESNRVFFGGTLPYKDVLKLQKTATLLVNPRMVDGEFVKYSFPSKTMEYFASGTPVLMYKLPGIPNDYYNYCYYIEEQSVDALTHKLEEVLKKNEKELMEMGKRAREFIFQHKLAKEQCARILKFIE